MALSLTEIKTGDTPDAAIIWLHGLGANGHDFVPIVPQLYLPDNLAINFIFPDAPERPITINQGYRMPGWYDISSLQIADIEDVSGIEESSQAIMEICQQQEARGIASSRIILAGFSQGGAIALHCGLNYPRPIAGMMALSSYLPACAPLGNAGQQSRASIFMAHGEFDDVVALKYALLSKQRLEQAGYSVDWHQYPMAHSVIMDEIRAISTWIQASLK